MSSPSPTTLPAKRPQAQPLLITGMSGFVGEHLARHLLAKGRRVAGTYLSTPAAVPGAEALPFEITDPAAWNRLLRDMKPAAIVHCAAKSKLGWCEEHPQEARAANLEAVEHLCGAVMERAPETPVVYFSTDLVFDGEAAPYGENAVAKPRNTYGSLKYAAETPVLELPRGMVLRSALVYGRPATRAASFLSWIVEGMRKGQEMPLFDDEWRTPVFVGDLAEAVRLLLEADPAETAAGIFHAGGAERLSRVRMGEFVAEVFDLPRELLRRTHRADAPGGEKRPADVSLRSERLLHLGWSQLSFRDGLKQCRDQWEMYKPR